MAFRRKRRTEPGDDGLADEVDVVARVLAHYQEGSPPAFGAPTRCPRCADYGLVEQVDPVRRASHNRCLTCGHSWVITARALRAARDLAALRPARPAVAGLAAPGGTLVPAPASQPVSARFDLDWTAPADLEPIVIDRGARVSVPTGDLTLLLVEDDPADADLVRLVLDGYDKGTVSLLHAETRAEGERLVGRHDDIDVVLLDLGLPDSSGLATLSGWRPARPSPPVVVLSGNGNTGLPEASRQLGAALYVHKHDLVDLAGSGSGADDLVAAFRSVTSVS